MAIRVVKVGDLFEAEVTPPHGRGRTWRSSNPQPIDDLIASLLGLGCHQTDIGDALYMADPDWLSRREMSAPGPGDISER